MAADPDAIAADAELREFYARLGAVTRPPKVTNVLVGLNVLVFVLMAFAGAGVFEANGEVAMRWGSNFGPYTVDGQWWRLLTSTFIHFGVFHLGFNMIALYQTGGTAERLFGSGRFLALYLFSGLTGSLASLWWHPATNGAGASGAIFGVFGGLLAFLVNPRNGVPRRVMVAHRNSTLLFAGYSLFYGAAHAGIDNSAHVGGLVGGFLMGLLLTRPLTAQARFRAAPGRLALAAAAGALLLAGLAWLALHPGDAARAERDYVAFELQLDTREDKAIALMNGANAHLAPPGDTAAYVRGMRAAASAWDGMAAQLRAIPVVPDARDAARREAMQRYLDARARFCHAAADAALGDEPAAQVAKDADAQAAAAIEALKRP
jgi:rhomboid protease GluP